MGTLLSTLLGKVTAGLLVVAVLALLYLGYEHLEDQKNLAVKDSTISQQKTTIDTQKGTIDQNKIELDGLKQQQTIDASARKTNTDQQTAITTKDSTVSQVAKRKIVDIEAKYASQPQTAAVLTRKDAEISQTRLTALTNVYCNSSPNDPACVTAAASAASVAASAASN